MGAGGKCPECGATVPADWPAGLCAKCLLSLGIGQAQNLANEPQSGSEPPKASPPGDPPQPPQAGARKVTAARFPSENLGDHIGGYKLLERIGHGGFGVVYFAEQQEPVKRRVALKIIKLGMDTRQVVARFEAERQALALMDHPNIAKILEAGATPAGRPYFVMELVGGIRITDYCEQNHLTTRQRLDLFIQVCRAVQHAHQKGVIHRDIKPSNVLVAMHDGVAVPKVIDFGIAKATQGKLSDKTVFTAFEQFLGTPAYMSPEQTQLGGLDVDTRSDIYSLGVLLYELLTGTTPFDTKELLAAGLDAMRRTIQEKEPPTPSTRLKLEAAQAAHGSSDPQIKNQKSKIANDLDWVVMKCLEKDRGRRYETANGLAMDLERHLNSEPVLASPPSRLYRFQKLVRRNRATATATAVVALVLVLGVLASTWQAVRATRAETEQRRLGQAARQQQQKEAQLRATSEERLYDSLVAQARALRIARRSGYRSKVLDLLRQATALPVPQKNLLALQREALGCMGDFVGLAPRLITVSTNKVLVNNTNNVWVTAFQLDPAGQRAAFLLSDSAIALYDLPSGELAGVLRPDVPVLSFCFGSATDRIISVHLPGRELTPKSLSKSEVRFWVRDLGGQWRENSRLSVPGATDCFSTTKGDCVLAWDGVQRTITLIRPDSGEKVAAFELPPLASLETVYEAVSRGGDKLAISSETPVGDAPSSKQTVIDLWDIGSKQRVQRWTTSMTGMRCLDFTADGKYLACLGGYGGVIYSVDGSEPATEFHENFENATRVGFAPQGTLIALPLAQQGRIRLWDWKKNQEVASLDGPGLGDVPFAPGGTSGLGDVAVARSGKFVLGINGAGACLYPLEIADGKLRLAGHSRAVTGLAFCPDGSQLASVGKDRKLIVWETATGSKVWESERLPGPGQTVAYSPDGALLATGDFETGLVQLWDARAAKTLLELGSKEDGRTWSTVFSPDGRYLAAASSVRSSDRGGWLHIWEVAWSEGQSSEISVRVTKLKSLPGLFRNVVFSPDSRTLAFWELQKDGRADAKVWDFNGPAAPRDLLKFTVFGRGSLEFTCDGQQLLLWNGELWALELVNILSGGANRFFGSDPNPSPKYYHGNHCLGPGDRILAYISNSGLGLDLWDTATKRLLYSLPEETGAVYGVAWSPDGGRFAVGRSTGEIAIWSLGRMAEFIAQLDSPPYEPASLRNKEGRGLDLKEDEEFAVFLTRLGSSLRAHGMLAESEARLREALSLMRKTVGSEHPDVALALGGLSVTLLNRREFAQAEAPAREALAINENLLGDQHPQTTQSRKHLAECLMEQGNYVEAEIHFRRLMATEQDVTQTVNRLGFALLGQGKEAQVEALYAEQLPGMRTRLPAEHFLLGEALATLSEALLSQGKFADAEAPARECLAIREKTVAGTSQPHARVRLGASLAGQKKYAEAEPLLSSNAASVLEQFKDELKGSCAACKRFWLRSTARNVQALVDLYKETGRPDQAANWEKVLRDFEAAVNGQ
jgi:serine/threonine protein kinase/WD40 repeat protein